MSYADAAKKGPAQADEDKVPHALPEIEHSDSGVQSIDTLSSDTNPNATSYADQQKAVEDAQKLEKEGKRLANEADRQARDFMSRAEKSAQDLEAQGKSAYKQGKNKYEQYTKEAAKDWDKMSKEAQKKYQDFSKDAGEEWEKAKVQGKKYADKAQKEGKEAEEWADKNKGNPVVIGNAVVVAALAGLIGTQAYRMHKAATFTWKIAGAWAGAVGLFAVGDYYVSQWLFKNKYPPKQ